MVFNRALFRAKCVEHEKTLEQASHALGINYATLSRKMNGTSDFTRNEIQLFRNWLGLSLEEVERIFFAD